MALEHAQFVVLSLLPNASYWRIPFAAVYGLGFGVGTVIADPLPRPHEVGGEGAHEIMRRVCTVLREGGANPLDESRPFGMHLEISDPRSMPESYDADGADFFLRTFLVTAQEVPS